MVHFVLAAHQVLKLNETTRAVNSGMKLVFTALSALADSKHGTLINID